MPKESASSASVERSVASETEGFEDFGATEGTSEEKASARALLGVRPPPKPFDQMSEEEQLNWMIGYVMPIAAEDFKAYDPERYASVSCELCHGPEPEKEHYRMPNPALPQLPKPGSPDWERMEKGRAFAFMRDVVTPTIATLVGKERWSPEVPNGFGCFDCHLERESK
ncbi:MAG: hypothetical protein NZM37_07975 [Sandaracinaceae bacterium]|nr:hypothetical protein [Sandaracinaceae bacterium]MDW8245848.1 hypothetical protein [Sandaracinaceae bacterium]